MKQLPLLSLFLALLAILPLRAADAADAFFSPAADKSIRTETYVDADVQTVWRTLTTGAGWEAFLGVKADIDLRPAGIFHILFNPDAPEGQRGSEGCTLLSYTPQRMLSFTWNAPPSFAAVRDGPHKTIVVIETLPAGASRTLVRLTHHGWPAAADSSPQWDEVFKYFEKAWPGVLSALKAHFAAKPSPPAEPSDQAAADKAKAESDPKNGWLYTFVALKREDLLATLTDEEKQQFSAHAGYIKDRCKEGTVVFAGPCTDMKGPACVILDVRTEAEARALMENDPAVKHGLMKANLHPVRLSFVRWRD